MLKKDLQDALRFYFITDDAAPDMPVPTQVKSAVIGGATMIQYRNKRFSPAGYAEAGAVRDLCKSNRVPFIVNDDILLAKALMADGVHVGQEDEAPSVARKILGPDAIIGVSVSTLEELAGTDLSTCNYIGTGPVYPTGTKADAKSVIGLEGLKRVADASPVPVVAIGGINEKNAGACFEYGAAGISLISAISRAGDPTASAGRLGRICGCPSREVMENPWDDEFGLIEKLVSRIPGPGADASWLVAPPGDDTALLKAVARPVITTDTHREGVHFSFNWQTAAEIGQKAVEITFSDLAAAYARPLCLFINLGLPAGISDGTVSDLYGGIGNALKRHGGEIGGGNIARAERLSLDLFALGQAREDIFPVRSSAKAGYGLYCTGPLGMARAGLAVLMNREDGYPGLVHRFKNPRARFDAAAILAGHGVRCAMDISDGLAGDAVHIAGASHVSIRLGIEQQLLAEELVRYADDHGLSAGDMAMAGGEDYELLFACPADVYEGIKKDLPRAYPVGECIPFTGEHVVNPPQRMASFQHGAKKE